jgi:hypothetical protein
MVDGAPQAMRLAIKYHKNVSQMLLPVQASDAQIAFCAGYAIEVWGQEGGLLALSQTDFDALAPTQIAEIGHSAKLVPTAIPTIEMAGGSVRCTIAGIHLAQRR